MRIPIDTRIQEFLARDDTRFIESIAEDIATHLSELREPLAGYAILTGDDSWVSDLVAAYDNGEGRESIVARFLGERFDVHSWQMSPHTFRRAQPVLERLNDQFRSLYPAREGSFETDEIEEAHVAKLHRSIIKGFCLARLRCPELRRRRVFKVFCIPDSSLDVDLRASRVLNSWWLHIMYRIWR